MAFVEQIITKYAEKADSFFKKQRDPYELANLFALFRVGEHHAVITIGDWLKSTPELEVNYDFKRRAPAFAGALRSHNFLFRV